MSDNEIETGDNIDKMGESAWGIDRRNNSIGDVSDRREMERLNDAHKLIE